MAERKKKKSARKRMRALRRRRRQRAVGLAVLVTLTGIVLLGGVLVLTTRTPDDRMSSFREAPATVHDDLLYLSYIDSLARDAHALPTRMTDSDLMAQDIVARAGVSEEKASMWGLFPPPEEGHGPLNELFRELNRRGRIILPLYGAALGTHLKERRLHPGYLVFGQTPRAGPNEADLCALLTAVNSIQPKYSVLLYRDPVTGDLVHGTFGDMPTFAYLGGGRLGDDIPAVYREYFQFRDARNRKPLY
jgi:hypothetical protein